jgi:hypothetical protein
VPSHCVLLFPCATSCQKSYTPSDRVLIIRFLSPLLLPQLQPVPFHRLPFVMPSKKAANGDSGEHHGEGKGDTGQHQHQAGTTTHREEDQWKHREPYKVHENDSDFKAIWTAQCHCGKVQYQLSREKPLSAKYCHCTTCQRLHGVSSACLPCVESSTPD